MLLSYSRSYIPFRNYYCPVTDVPRAIYKLVAFAEDDLLRLIRQLDNSQSAVLRSRRRI